jgi:hypothetical protein
VSSKKYRSRQIESKILAERNAAQLAEQKIFNPIRKETVLSARRNFTASSESLAVRNEIELWRGHDWAFPKK